MWLGIFENGYLLLRIWLKSTCNQHFQAPKWRFSDTLSILEIFENGDSSYLCGRVKTVFFNYDDIMPRFKAHSSAHMI